MRIALYYISNKRGRGLHAIERQPIVLVKFDRTVFIRVEEVMAVDEVAALDMARPDEDEAFMNSHAVPTASESTASAPARFTSHD